MTNLYLIDDDSKEKIFFDNPRKCFDNAVKKKAFSKLQVLNQDNYIMYMCSDFKFDYFKSKLTKTKYTVERWLNLFF